MCANGTIFLDPQIDNLLPQKDLSIFQTPKNSKIVIAHFVRKGPLLHQAGFTLTSPREIQNQFSICHLPFTLPHYSHGNNMATRKILYIS
jgi:hypothetical protein